MAILSQNYGRLLINFAKRHKHQLMLAGGITSTVATGVTGVRSGMRIERKLRYLEEKEGRPLTKKEIAKAAAPELIPVAISGGSSVGFQTALYVSTIKRINGLMTTVGALSTQIDNIKKAEKEVVGEHKAEEIQQKAEEKPNCTFGSTNPDDIKSANGYCWFKTEHSGAELYARREDIIRAVSLTNRDLTWRDCSENEFLMYIDKIGSNHYFYSDCGEYAGWKNGTYLEVDIDHYTTLLNDGTPAVLIAYRPKVTILPKRLND